METQFEDRESLSVFSSPWDLIAEITRLRAEFAEERDRLRDALTTIKALADLSGFGASYETIFQMRGIARAALKENNDGN